MTLVIPALAEATSVLEWSGVAVGSSGVGVSVGSAGSCIWLGVGSLPGIEFAMDRLWPTDRALVHCYHAGSHDRHFNAWHLPLDSA